MGKIRALFAILTIVSLWFAHIPSAEAYGVGWCHYFGGTNNPNVQYIYPGSSLTWAKVEPTEGNYNFSELDTFIQQARAVGKKLHIQFLVSNPSVDADRMLTVPQWAIDKGMHVVTSSGGFPTMPIQWDPLYMQYHEKLLKAFAARYEKPEYYDVIEAVVMQSGGNWGEMALPVKNAADKGADADALNPDNLFVREIARVFLGSEDRAGEIARKEGNRWIFDDYFIRAVNNITDLYARSLTHYPFAIQLGYGLTWQQRVGQEPVEFGISHYGSRMWIRSAAWGSFDMGNSDPSAQDFWGRYQDRTVLVYEVGHPSWWCAAEGGNQKGGCYDCCQWDTKAEANRHNSNNITTALNSGAVAVCLQQEFFHNPSKYNLDFSRLSSGLLENARKRSNLLGDVPPVPSPTSTPRSITATLAPPHTPVPRVTDDSIRATPTQSARSTMEPTQVMPSPLIPTSPLPTAVDWTTLKVNTQTSSPIQRILCQNTMGTRTGLGLILSLPETVATSLLDVDTSIERAIETSLRDIAGKWAHQTN